MGYSTDFDGSVNIEPPLNTEEIRYLQRFSRTRHMHREQGPYYVDLNSDAYDQSEHGVYSYNKPPPPQPSLWCNFEPNDDGTALIWNEAEKTQCAKEWIEYLITRFLAPNAITQDQDIPFFKNFQYNHICNGEFLAQGENIRDRWILKVKNNKVSVEKLK